MKKNPTNLPCTQAAENMIIGLHGYAGFGTYIKLLQIIYELPDRCMPKESLLHISLSNGMDSFIVEQLFEMPSLFISDETRYFPVDAKVIHKKEKLVDNAIIAEHDLQKYIKKFFPIVSSMDIQMSVENCESLIKNYPKKLIVEKLMAMENYKGLTKKYTNVYLTLNNWCRMAMERGWVPADNTVRATGTQTVRA